MRGALYAASGYAEEVERVRALLRDRARRHQPHFAEFLQAWEQLGLRGGGIVTAR